MTTLRRDDLAQFFGSNPRLLRAFEEQAAIVEDVSNGVSDTQALKDATVVVLSANGDFTNERVLQIGDGLQVQITDTTVRISAKNLAKTQDHNVTLIPPAAVVLFLPPDGMLLSDTFFAALGNYASDAAAATAGVGIGGLYHNAGAIRLRLT